MYWYSILFKRVCLLSKNLTEAENVIGVRIFIHNHISRKKGANRFLWLKPSRQRERTTGKKK